MEDVKKILADNLMTLAEGRNAYQLHKLTGVNRDRLEAILAGQGNIRLETLAQLAHGLGVRAQALLASQEAPSTPSLLTEEERKKAIQLTKTLLEKLENPRSPK